MRSTASPSRPDTPILRRVAFHRRDAHPAWAALVTACAALGLALPPPMSRARGAEVELDDMSIADLKRVYLACDRAADDGRLTRAGVMHCSVVYETLKRRAFGGDFDRLREWSRTQLTTTGGHTR